jgi:GntR family transcriptional regulator, transcriptional repressor for pyruvate dehydrogenase complex
MADLINGTPSMALSEPVRDKRTDEWAPVARVRTYELVLQRIEAQIVSGTLRAGERLPPERDLAELLGVSRPAVREALRVLEAQGVVRSQVGQGPGSGTTIERVPSDALTRLLRLHVALGSFPFADVIETRVTLERSIVVLACRNARPENVERMRAILTAMDDPEITREMFNQLDIDFHVELAEAGGNRLMCDMTRAIRESVRVPFLAAVKAMPETGRYSWPSMLTSLQVEHHAVLSALEAGEGDKAADLLESHIRGFYLDLAKAT